MKIVKKLIFAGLFSALYLVPTTTLAATEEERMATATVRTARGVTTTLDSAPHRHQIFRLAAPEENQGCRARFGRCLAKTKKAVDQILPILEFTLEFLSEGDLKDHVRTAIAAAKKGSKHIIVNEDGSIQFPDGALVGQTLANAVLLVANDKAEILTDESEMMLSLVLSLLPEGDYQSKIKLIGYMALADDPKTDIVLTFNAEDGTVGLAKGRAAAPFKSIPLFVDGITTEGQDFLRQYFAEYVKATQVRTAKEKETEGDGRAPGIFLPKEGKIIPAYRGLIQSDPTYKLVKLAEGVVTGETSVVDALGNWVNSDA